MTYVALAIRPSDDGLCFRNSVVLPRSRLWLRNGVTIPVGARVFDLLVTLLAYRGVIKSKAEILQSVWPATVVGEDNVRIQMVALRRALGADADLVKTVPGRGYLFAEDVPTALQIGSAQPSATPLETTPYLVGHQR